MKKIIKSTAIVLLSIASLGVAQARDLTVVGWGGTAQDAHRKAFFEPFIKKTNFPIVEDTWGGGYGILQSKVQAGVPNWDVVMVEAEELSLGCQDGLFEKLDWSKIGNKDDFIDGSVSDCGAGSYVWSTTLAYDKDRFPENGPKNWVDFWDKKKYPGKRTLRKGPKFTLEYALMADGVPATEVYDVLSTPEGVDRAFKKLDDIKSDIIWWESGTQPVQLLISGDVVMAAAYSARIDAVDKLENRHLQIVWNQSIYSIDSWVIMKNSPNIDNATKLIAFIEAYEQQSRVPQYLAYGVINKKAAMDIDPERNKDLPTNPDNMKVSIPINVEFWTDNLEALTERYNAWLAQ